MFDWFDFKNQQFVNKDFDTIFSIRSSQLIVRILPADISCWLSLMSFRRYYLFLQQGMHYQIFLKVIILKIIKYG